MPTPKRESNELIRQINAAWSNDTPPSEFALAGLKRKYAQIEKGLTEPEQYVLKGILATCEYDLDSLHRNHQAAIALEKDPMNFYNYAASLNRVGLTFLAMQEYRQGYEADPLNKEGALALAEKLLCVGLVGDIDNLQILNDEDLDSLGLSKEVIENFVSFYAENGIKSEDIAFLNSAIDSFMQERNVISIDRKPFPVDIEEEEDSFLQIKVKVKESMEDAIELGIKFCEMLAECELPGAINSRVSVRFIAA